MDENDWSFWSAGLRGEHPETTPGTPWPGFYRDRSSRAVAIWKQDGVFQCAVTSGYCPRHVDEIDGLFAAVCRAPITRELYMQIAEGGAWPEDIQAPARGMGDNRAGMAEHEAIAAEIDDLAESARDWLQSIGGAVATQQQADKVANYADAFGELEKRADAARKTEKEPHDKAAKAVQQKWLPVVEMAEVNKKRMKKVFETFAIAEKRRREEEARKAAAEAAKQAEVMGDPPPPPPQAPVRVNAGTRGKVALKTRVDFVVTDRRAFGEFLLAMDNPPPDLIEALEKIARRMGVSGVAIPGVERREIEFAA